MSVPAGCFLLNPGKREKIRHKCLKDYSLEKNKALKRKRKRKINEFMSNDITQTITRISEIIINELKLEDVTPETFDADLDLVNEVGIDSMDMATIALFLRDEYEIQIDEDDYPKLTTVRIIAEYIEDKLNSSE
jgi:acyl carrier protein